MASQLIPRGRPFTRQQALASGLTDRHLAAGYQRLFRAVYLPKDAELTPARLGSAALMAVGEGRLSHASAGRLYRLPVTLPAEEHVTVGKPLGRRSRQGLVIHHDRDGSHMTLDGLPVSTPAQLCVELASMLGVVELVVAYDFMLKREWITLDQLRALVRRGRGVAGERSRQAAELARERVDSPMESRLRVLLVLAGVPCPEMNLTFGINGQRRRYDLSWPEIGLIVEYDGRPHIEREEQWEADLGRREDIENDGWRMLVVIAPDFYRSPGDLIERVWRVLTDRGLPGLPAQSSPAWRRHFG